MRYESQIHIVNGELQSLQNQVLRFKREKDTYKHMLESAQKTIGELKQNPLAAKEGPKNYDEVTIFHLPCNSFCIFSFLDGRVQA